MTEKRIVQRQSNFELLRIVSMLMIVAIHLLNHGKALYVYDFGTFGYYALYFLYAVVHKSVNLFVMLTGYFMVNSKLKPSKLFKLIVQVFTYSVAICVLSRLFLSDELSLERLLEAGTPVLSGEYWFCTCYFLLILATPLLNRAIDRLNKKEHLLTIIVMLALFSILVTMVYWESDRFGSDGYSLLWFIVIYFIASYIKKYDISISKKTALCICIVSDLLIALSVFVIGNVTLRIFGSVEYVRMFYTYSSPLVLASTIGFFLFFKQVKITNSKLEKLICKISVLSFGVYLIHDNNFVRKPLWKFVGVDRILQNNGLLAFFGYSIVVIITIFAVGCIVEAIRAFIFNHIGLKKLAGVIDEKFEMLSDKLDKALK